MVRAATLCWAPSDHLVARSHTHALPLSLPSEQLSLWERCQHGEALQLETAGKKVRGRRVVARFGHGLWVTPFINCWLLFQMRSQVAFNHEPTSRARAVGAHSWVDIESRPAHGGIR